VTPAWRGARHQTRSDFDWIDSDPQPFEDPRILTVDRNVHEEQFSTLALLQGAATWRIYCMTPETFSNYSND